MIDAETRALAERVLEACRARGWKVATAESCTGGLVAGALTEIAGSSDVVDRGFVTYSNAAKMAMLGVPEATLAAHGAVSKPTAEAMARGALARAGVDLTVSITGVAGPGGGSAEKPVGLVHFAAAAKDGRLIHREKRYGDLGRSEIRRLSVIEALAMLLELSCLAIELLAQHRTDDVGIVVGPRHDRAGVDLVPAFRVRQQAEIGFVARQHCDHRGRLQVVREVGRVAVGLEQAYQPLGGAERRHDLRELQVAVGDVQQQHAVR